MSIFNDPQFLYGVRWALGASIAVCGFCAILFALGIVSLYLGLVLVRAYTRASSILARAKEWDAPYGTARKRFYRGLNKEKKSEEKSSK